MKLLIQFGVNIPISIIRLIHLKVINLSGAAKIFVMVIVIYGIKKYLLCTKVLGIVAYRVPSKMLGIGSAEFSCGDVKIIRSGKISALGSEISDKQSILYKCSCI